MAAEEHRGSLSEGALVGGRFRVKRLIGHGGMGEVYAAQHTTTGKPVALKLILRASGTGKEHVRRFMREARAATAIQHPNVIEVFDVFEDTDGTPVMVMELLEGEPFSALRERKGALLLHEVAAILVPALRALTVAHAKGIVHRDLKPDNVFLATTAIGQTTKVLDFGIAKVLDPTKLSAETHGQHTNTGSILGTPHYMSYEQAMSEKDIDHRSDVWSMGVMVFEALTGRRPLTFDTLGQMYTSFLQGSIPRIREFVPDLPEDVATALDRCLVKERAGRLADLGELADVLARYADPRTAGAMAGGRVVDAPVAALPSRTDAALATSTGTGRREPRRWTWFVGAAAALGLIGAGLAAAPRPPQRDIASAGPTTAAEAPPAGPSAAASLSPALDAGRAPLETGSPPPPPASAAAMSHAATRPRSAAPAPRGSTAPSATPAPKHGISDRLPY